MAVSYRNPGQSVSAGEKLLGIDASSGALLSTVTLPNQKADLFFADSMWGQDAFAKISSLTSNVAELGAEIQTLHDQLHDQRERSDAQAALASAMQFALPLDGAKNRFGSNLGEFNGTTAIGFSYTRVEGNFDAHVSFATTQHYSAGSVGVGISW